MRKKTLKNIALGSILGVSILGAGYIGMNIGIDKGFKKGAYETQAYFAEKYPGLHKNLYEDFDYSTQNPSVLNVLRKPTPLEEITYGLRDSRD